MSDPIRIVDGYYDRVSVKKAVTASTDIATFLGVTITNADHGITIKSDGTLHYEVDGTDADANNAQLPTIYSVHGKQNIENVRLYSAASQDVSIILFARNT